MNKKASIRTTMLAQRDALAADEHARKSNCICNTLSELTAALAHNSTPPRVAVYAPMRSEVNVLAFVQEAYARGWDVCFPCMVRDTPGEPSTMVFVCVPRERFDEAYEAFLCHPLRCLTCAELEERDYALAPVRTLDCIIVPLVAFDDVGNRLGYGGGNYDRALPQLRPDALVIGVAFDEQRMEAVPCEPHDCPLPHIAHA